MKKWSIFLTIFFFSIFVCALKYVHMIRVSDISFFCFCWKNEKLDWPKCARTYPVTAYPPNFDFWAGCHEIKRCEESKRTLKNPFASRLAKFNNTLKLLRITDQWYIVPDLGQIWIFWRYFFCLWPEDQTMGSALIPIEGLFLLLLPY